MLRVYLIIKPLFYYLFLYFKKLGKLAIKFKKISMGFIFRNLLWASKVDEETTL